MAAPEGESSLLPHSEDDPGVIASIAQEALLMLCITKRGRYDVVGSNIWGYL